jgi:hypothetical protein
MIFSLPSPRRRRGSVLLVSLLFSAVIAISLGSFLHLATQATRVSYRTYHLGVGMNIAETGLEQALWSINRSLRGDADAWNGWTRVGSDYRRTFDLGTIEGGATAQVKVYARAGMSAPFVIARAIITPPVGQPVEKWIKVTLSRRSYYTVGGLGREGIRASGNNVYFASWNSDPDNNGSYVPFGEAVKRDRMGLATTELDASIDSGQADVNGRAAVGGDSLDQIKVGPQGYIGPFGTPPGTKDPASVSTDFTTDLRVPEVPAATYKSIGAINGNTELPGPSDVPENGVYYYYATQIALQNSTLSIKPGAHVVIHVEHKAGGSVTIGGGSGAIVAGGSLVTNTLTGEQTYNPAKLEIYTSGDISIGGKGAANQLVTQNHTPAVTQPTTTTTTTTIANVQEVMGRGKDKNTVIGWSYNQTVTITTQVGDGPATVTFGPKTTNYTALIADGATRPVPGTTTSSTTGNVTTPATTVDTGTVPGQPKNFMIFGTRTPDEVALIGEQDIKISGNGSLSGVIDAPYANIAAKGGGNSGFIYGSLIGNSLTFTGNDCFYYDESLANLDDDGRFGIDNWSEMVGYADRQTYGALMNF